MKRNILIAVLILILLTSGCIGSQTPQEKGKTGTSSGLSITTTSLGTTPHNEQTSTSITPTTTTTEESGTHTPTSTSSQRETSTTTSTTSTATREKTWKPDGIISPREYNLSVRSGEFEAFFRVENDTLMVGLKAQTPGWVAIGFGGGPGMKNTDIVIAYILPNGTVMISDSYSTGFAGPHNPDELYGGRNDILAYGGRAEDGYTTVEFSRKLNTGDPYDAIIEPSKGIRAIWAYSFVDDFVSDHMEAGEWRITIPEG